LSSLFWLLFFLILFYFGLVELTRVELGFFCVFFFSFIFHHLVWLRVDLYYFIKFLLYRVISISWLGLEFGITTWVRFFFVFFLKKFFCTLTFSLLVYAAFDSNCHTYRQIYRRIYSVGISYTHRQIYRRDVAVGKSRYHRWNKNPLVYFKRESFFFCAQIPSVKPLANGFFVLPTVIATEWEITDESKADGRNPLMRTLVNKSPTNF